MHAKVQKMVVLHLKISSIFDSLKSNCHFNANLVKYVGHSGHFGE